MDQQNPATADATHSGRNAPGAVPDERAVWLPLDALRPWDRNPRLNDGKPTAKVAESLRHFGFVNPIVVWVGGDRMVAGHTRLKALRALLAEDPSFTPKGAPGPGLARVVFHEFGSEAEADLYALADNKLGELAAWDEEAVAEIQAAYGPEELAIAGFDEDAVDPDEAQAGGGSIAPPGQGSLAEQFGVPPFSVLDARQGYWQERKRAWLALGIKSEEGRADKLLYAAESIANVNHYRDKRRAAAAAAKNEAG